MTAFRRGDRWAAKFVLNAKQRWVPNGPWDTKRQAEEAERRHRDFLTARRTDETCASFAERWLTEWERPSPATRRLYEAAARRFADHFGPTPIGEVERLSARTWALTVPRSLSRVIGTMYEDARNVGLVESNPFSNLRLPATEKPAEITAPSMDEYRALLDACPVLGGYAKEFRAMLTFAGWTGIRQGELFALQWSEVGEEEIMVCRSRKFDGTIGLPKHDYVSPMPFLPPARVLDQVPRRPDPFVFHSPRGQLLLRGTHAWSWQKVKASAGVDCRWHDLRHFCATQLLELGYSHFDVSIQLRHRDGGFQVQNRYGHPSVEAARRRLLDGFKLGDEGIGSTATTQEAGRG